ncbi:MAG: insulinase family protein [Candidatus Eisenbacteria bacterium]|nr:insulinase family protein [Candidatus Eisenbacteria bacterium]
MRRVIPLILVASALLLLASVTHAATPFRKVLPENGLTVILSENHSSPVVNLRFYVRAGSIYEGEYLGCGISHFCEHLVANGPTATRTAEEYEMELEQIGGGSNAYTTKDHTCYFIETSSEHFDKALELLADKAMNVQFPQELVDTQQGIIVREINMGYDEPSRRLYNLFGEVMFREHPHRYPVIGYVENFERLTRDDAQKYHDNMYVPNNIVFVAAGDFDTQQAYEKIRDAFKDFERKPVEIPTLPEEPTQMGRRELREQRDIETAYVRVGLHTVPLSDPDMYPLDILSHILSEGRSSRLHRRLVEELGAAHEVSTYSHTPSYDAGSFGVMISTDPANVDAAIDAALAEIYKLRTEKVSKDELEKAKKIKTAEFYYQQQELEGLAGSLGTSELATGNPEFWGRIYAEQIQATTAEQIMAVAKKYFRDDNVSVAVLEPRSEGEPLLQTSRSGGPEVGPIEKHVLDNGLTVLIKENHTIPVVSVGSFSLAGARLDPDGGNGLANFVARMMPRGTKKRKAESISEAFDSMGAGYNCSANHTRIQSELTLLSEDFQKGLDVFADILMNPRFDQREMEKERELIQAAILSRGDDWNADAMDRMLTELFRDHPYGKCPVGTAETVAAFTRDDLRTHHDRYVTPNNTVITVFGDVDSGNALALVEKAMGRWKSGPTISPDLALEPPRTEPETLTSYHDRAQTVIFRGYQGMPYSSQDGYAMDVLDAITSGIYYPGGWLHTELRGNQLVYVVHAYNFTGYDTGYFGLYAATYDDALDQAMEIIDSDMTRIASELVGEEELEKAKQLCTIMRETTRQTNAAQASDAAIAELYGLGYDYTEDYPAKIAAVTSEDVRAVAQKYLKNPVTILRRPQPAEQVSHAD